VVDFEKENSMPWRCRNVARNLTALKVATEIYGVVGQDHAAGNSKNYSPSIHIGCRGLVTCRTRPTSVKTRIVAHTQQVVRIDREARDGIDGPSAAGWQAVWSK
jgi:D-beta-D-heptose 7-phosphate kinase/D-beta-D-heptose 1-phosphate adenosyltransferase